MLLSLRREESNQPFMRKLMACGWTAAVLATARRHARVRAFDQLTRTGAGTSMFSFARSVSFSCSDSLVLFADFLLNHDLLVGLRPFMNEAPMFW